MKTTARIALTILVPDLPDTAATGELARRFADQLAHSLVGFAGMLGVLSARVDTKIEFGQQVAPAPAPKGDAS